MGQEKEFEKQVGKDTAETFTKILADGRSAKQNKVMFQDINNLLEGAYTGAGGELYQSFAKGAKTLGFNLDKVGEKEAAKALMGQIALKLRKDMPGAMSDADRNFLVKEANPSLSTTPEGRKKLYELYVKIENWKEGLANKVQEGYNRGASSNQISTIIQDYANQNSISAGEVLSTVPKRSDVVKTNNSTTVRQSGIQQNKLSLGESYADKILNMGR
jgi:hypothetical protein